MKVVSDSENLEAKLRASLDTRTLECINLNDLGKIIYEVNKANGFYDRPVVFAERIALMHSELSEALEADRKDLMDDKLPHRKGIEVELADCLIRILDCAAVMGMDIHGATMEKLEINKTRGWRHGGKKY